MSHTKYNHILCFYHNSYRIYSFKMNEPFVIHHDIFSPGVYMSHNRCHIAGSLIHIFRSLTKAKNMKKALTRLMRIHES